MDVAERCRGMRVVRADSHNSSEPESQSRLPDMADESSLTSDRQSQQQKERKQNKFAGVNRPRFLIGQSR